MPFINVKIHGPALSPEQTKRIQVDASHLLADLMAKKLERIGVLVEQQPNFAWSVGGEPVKVAANLEVTIMTGSNTPEQKAAFIKAAYQMLHDVLGPEMTPFTYVILREEAGDAWGFEGSTNSHRYEIEKAVA